MFSKPKNYADLLKAPRQRGSRISVPISFFRKRGALDLSRDTSRHRRFAWLYEDTLE